MRDAALLLPLAAAGAAAAGAAAPFAPFMPGVWGRRYIRRGAPLGPPNGNQTVRNVQAGESAGSPGFAPYSDVRVPRSARANTTGYPSLASMPAAVLAALADQQGFAGVASSAPAAAPAYTVTWAHRIDYWPPSADVDRGTAAPGGGGSASMVESGDGYEEHWWRVSSGDGRHLALVASDVAAPHAWRALLVVVGDHFAFARARRRALPAAASLRALIAAARPDRETLAEWLDCELSHGRVFAAAAAAPGWVVDLSTLPFREGTALPFVAGGCVNGSDVAQPPPRRCADAHHLHGTEWRMLRNTIPDADLRVMFAF